MVRGGRRFAEFVIVSKYVCAFTRPFGMHALVAMIDLDKCWLTCACFDLYTDATETNITANTALSLEL